MGLGGSFWTSVMAYMFLWSMYFPKNHVSFSPQSGTDNSNFLGLAHRLYTMLDSVLFELFNISHEINIGQETVKHLSRDLMFVVSDKMTHIK